MALTSREEQVLELAATRLTVSQIGQAPHMSHSTAKTHLLRVYEKLGAPNRSAAVVNPLALGTLHVSSPAARCSGASHELSSVRSTRRRFAIGHRAADRLRRD
ncbi:MAG: response regulator transcription factor [Solirubrobacteraceae bacterium]